ncbi:hypothetical protein MAV_4607 [Mycobacterium avium 104]|uniref:Uncharacterized protein n=1 Tax=Mycobacterium avium (strain 104) TaxID=243243 RepID=A0A0H2ZSW4_MYCA1|nr:hypothetical protein MAV_4607 [Mycobacterium avium 104]
MHCSLANIFSVRVPWQWRATGSAAEVIPRRPSGPSKSWLRCASRRSLTAE